MLLRILKTAVAVSGKWHKGSNHRNSNLKKKPKIETWIVDCWSVNCQLQKFGK